MSTREVIKVVVGIVTCNHRRFIAQCLESVPASAKQNSIRVIVVDNGSSDGSARLCGIGIRGLK